MSYTALKQENIILPDYIASNNTINVMFKKVPSISNCSNENELKYAKLGRTFIHCFIHYGGNYNTHGYHEGVLTTNDVNRCGNNINYVRLPVEVNNKLELFNRAVELGFNRVPIDKAEQAKSLITGIYLPTIKRESFTCSTVIAYLLNLDKPEIYTADKLFSRLQLYRINESFNI